MFRAPTICPNHRENPQVRNWSGNGGKKKTSDEEGRDQIAGKLHQRSPVLMRKYIVHSLRHGIHDSALPITRLPTQHWAG